MLQRFLFIFQLKKMKAVRYTKNNVHFSIKENSLLAKAAAFKLGEKRVAIVLGRTIHLHNCDTKTFLDNDRWLRHELTHILQFRKYGLLKFVFLYLIESIRHGYYNNRYEVEARMSEEG